MSTVPLADSTAVVSEADIEVQQEMRHLEENVMPNMEGNHSHVGPDVSAAYPTNLHPQSYQPPQLHSQHQLSDASQSSTQPTQPHPFMGGGMQIHGYMHHGLGAPRESDEDDDDDHPDGKPLHAKEALTYSFAITIAHEIAGTFMFVYSIMAVATAPTATTTDVAFAIATAAMVYSHVFNKAHFNTWITLYFFMIDYLGRAWDHELLELYPEHYRGLSAVPRDSKRAVRFMSFVHIVCQIIGSILASWLIWHFPHTDSENFALTGVAAGFMKEGTGAPSTKGVIAVMFLEFILTYALLYSIDIGDPSNHRPGRSRSVFFSVGPPIVLFLGVRTIGDFTGASFNFARTFGPAVVSGNWSYGSIGYYSVAHFLAVCLAVTVEQYRFKKHIRMRRKAINLLRESRDYRRSQGFASNGPSRQASRKTTHIPQAQAQAQSRKPTRHY